MFRNCFGVTLMLRSVWVLLAGLLIATSTNAAEPSIRFQKDVVYATFDGEKVQLDMAMPLGAGPHPVVVCFHGGAWKYGSRKDLSKPSVADMDFGTGKKSLIEWLAERGFAGVSVGYRLAPKNKFPAQIEDAKTAVRYLRANAKALNLDPTRIAALGFSAGGHLAALLGTTDSGAGFEGTLYHEQSSQVQCVVDFFGPADLSLYSETEGIEKAFMVPLLGARYASQPNIYKKASPIEHVTKESAPFLIIHGTADVIVPVIHSERLHDKLIAAGARSELVTVSGKGHGWGGEPAVETMGTAIKFLKAELKAK